jgi:hypothetical protein
MNLWFTSSLVVVFAITQVSAADSSPSAAPSLAEHRVSSAGSVHVIVVTDDEIAFVIEDLTGQTASRRQIRHYADLARTRGWDRDMFVYEFRRSDEFRALRPERVVEDSFRRLLGRSPTRRELRHYVGLLTSEQMTPGQMRRELRDSDEYREHEADEIIDRVFPELLERKPSPEDRQHYRKQILRRGYTEEDVRRKLKESTEYRVTLPNEKIVRAFVAVLGREPDLSGCEPFRRLILDRGYSEENLREHLRRSEEFRERSKLLITRIYQEMLEREPDPQGLEHYRRAMIDRGWTEHQVRESIRRSEEYRNRSRPNR